MNRTLEVIDEHRNVQLLESIRLAGSKRALVTILDDDSEGSVPDTTLLSESALADWNRPAEDEAWAYLQSEQ